MPKRVSFVEFQELQRELDQRVRSVKQFRKLDSDDEALLVIQEEDMHWASITERPAGLRITTATRKDITPIN